MKDSKIGESFKLHLRSDFKSQNINLGGRRAAERQWKLIFVLCLLVNFSLIQPVLIFFFLIYAAFKSLCKLLLNMRKETQGLSHLAIMLRNGQRDKMGDRKLIFQREKSHYKVKSPKYKLSFWKTFGHGKI